MEEMKRQEKKALEEADAARFKGKEAKEPKTLTQFQIYEQKTKREAVVKALEDFNRRQRVELFLKEAAGSMPDFPSNDEIEAADMEYEDRIRKLWGREEAS